MKRLTLLALLGLIVSGCGNDPREFKTVDPEAVEYYQDFQKDFEDFSNESGEGIWDIGLGFVEGYDSQHTGECHVNKVNRKTYKYITVSREYWESSSIKMKRAMVYHELGHCFLGKEHESGKSIMNPLLPVELSNAHHTLYDAYIYELFSGDDSKILEAE